MNNRLVVNAGYVSRGHAVFVIVRHYLGLNLPILHAYRHAGYVSDIQTYHRWLMLWLINKLVQNFVFTKMSTR
jgi:hypothetical protein